MTASIVLVLDTRRAKKAQKYPVKLRVTFNREPQYYQTVFDLTEDDWQKFTASRISQDLQSVRDKLKKIERSATFAAEKILPFSFPVFERSFVLNHPLLKQRKNKLAAVPVEAEEDDFDFTPLHKRFSILVEKNCKPGTLTWSYQQYIKNLIREGRIGTALSYKCSYVSLKNFKGNVLLSDITVPFLTAYEKKLRECGVSKSTIGIYLRPLRAIFNDAIAKGLLLRETSYPFGAKLYQIPTAKKAKKALTLTDVESIYFYRCDTVDGNEQKAKDYWLFSYFANGMNPKDIAFLRWKDLDGEYIIFERAKTERSLRGEPVVITVYVNDDMRAIIKRWGNIDRSPDNYIFPILRKGLTAMQVYNRIQDFVSFINDWMREIVGNLGIEKKATTYVARHTFSTILKRSGASTEYIKEALGHLRLETTEGYLGSFETETTKEMSTRLLAFKNQPTHKILSKDNK